MDKPFKDLTAKEAKEFLDARSVDSLNLLDVRQDWEYEEFHLPGARLIPLPELLDRLNEISTEKPTLVYCASGGRSVAAAQLMNGQGFGDLHNLKGGITAWKGEYAVGPEDLGMAFITGNESAMDLLAIAYRMEINLGQFFSNMADTSNPDIATVFKQLVKFENGHKAKVYNMARALDPDLESRQALEMRFETTILEGAMSADDFMRTNAEYLKSPRGVIEAAMIFEVQALDLYIRYASKAGKDDSIKMLQTLAQEEKNHLAVLGKLLTRENIA